MKDWLLTPTEINIVGSATVKRVKTQPDPDCYEAELTDAIAKAAVSKVVKLLNEPCTDDTHKPDGYFRTARRLCPVCMKELEEATK